MGNQYSHDMLKRAIVFWFTGLSGSGKSTLAQGLFNSLIKEGLKVLILDGDDLRNQAHRHLGFTPEDIRKNNELIVSLCEKKRNEYDFILVPIISPYRDSRANARFKLAPDFHEIYIRADLQTLNIRDTKGLYRAFKKNEINNLIGVSSTNPYEVPESSDLLIDTAAETLQLSSERLLIFANQCLVEQKTI